MLLMRNSKSNAVFFARDSAEHEKNGWMLPVSAWSSMPQRFGFDSTPGLQVFGGVGEPLLSEGSELSAMRSIEPELSTSSRTFGSCLFVVPAICACASLSANTAAEADARSA